MNDKMVYDFKDRAIEYRTELVAMIELYCSVEVEDYPESNIDFEKIAIEKSKRIILDDIEKYISSELNQTYNGVNKIAISKISLPYIYDAEMRNKDMRIKYLELESEADEKMMQGYRREIYNLMLPWYKKLWRKIK